MYRRAYRTKNMKKLEKKGSMNQRTDLVLGRFRSRMNACPPGMCPLTLYRSLLQISINQSCGKCVPCREGTKRMLEILERITEGSGQDGDIELLEELADTISNTALCGLGKTAPSPVISTIKNFREEYEAHIYQKRCPAGACWHRCPGALSSGT